MQQSTLWGCPVVIIIESYNQQHPKAGVGSAPNHNKQKSISRCARILIRPNCSYGPCCPSPVPRKGRAGLCCAAVWHACEARASAPAFMPPNCPRVRQSQACVARAQCLCLHATHSCCWDQRVQTRPPAIQSLPGKHSFKLMQTLAPMGSGCRCKDWNHREPEIRPPTIQSIPGKHGFKLMQPWPQRTRVPV